MSEDAIKSAITTVTQLLDELREVMDIYSYQEADVKIVLDAAARSVRLYQENERLKEVLRLAVDDLNEACDICHYDTIRDFTKCEKCKGENWQWQHADKLKGLIEI